MRRVSIHQTQGWNYFFAGRAVREIEKGCHILRSPPEPRIEANPYSAIPAEQLDELEVAGEADCEFQHFLLYFAGTETKLATVDLP